VEENFSSTVSLATVLVTLFTISDNSDLLNLHPRMHRECHRYVKTRGFEVTGFAGTVVGFSTPRHTAYLYRGITGIPGVYYNKVSIIFIVLKLVFSHIKFIVSHCDATKYGYAICASIFTSYRLSLALAPHFKTW
jgi:hypothetical protein